MAGMPDKIAHALAEKFAAFRDRENQLLDELVRYKAVLDVVPCPMVLTDTTGKLVYANESYRRMLGVTLDEVADVGWHDSVMPDDLERITRLWDESVAAKLHQFEDWITYKKVGRVFWRARRLPDGSYAAAIFHPACAFFAFTGTDCPLEGCTNKPGIA